MDNKKNAQNLGNVWFLKVHEKDVNNLESEGISILCKAIGNSGSNWSVGVKYFVYFALQKLT